MAGRGSQMKKSCDCCGRYVDHLDGKMKCFRKNMTAHFRHSMIIPNKFLNHFGGKIARTIELESPDGNVYVVQVTKHINKTVLRCGWEAFVDAHHIEENDSLLFRHIESSRFEVLILDSDGCEKVFSCAGIEITSNVQERGAHYVDISNSSCDNTAKSSGSKRFARCERGNSSFRRKTAKAAATYYSSEDSGEDTKDSPPEYESSFELDDLQTPPGPDYVLSRGSSLSGAQEEKVSMLVRDIQPEIPVFVAIMRQSNVHSRQPGLVIPRHYGDAHMPHKSQTVALQRAGKNKKWHAKFYITNDQSRRILYGRWLDFVRDNRVHEGDICIFQPMKCTGRKFTLTVHLLRESKSHSAGVSGPKRVRSSDGRKKTKTTGHKRVSSSEGRTGTKATATTRVKEEPDDGEKSPSSRCNHGHADQRHEHLESDDSGEPSKPLYILQGKAILTREQAKKVEERARAIHSDVPIYVSIMNKSSAGANSVCTITFGKQYATEYLPDGEQTLTLLRIGKSKTWEVNMRPRIGDAQTLTRGWRDFVHDNRLQVEDICLFQLIKNERRLLMKVYIIRHNEKR